MLYAMANQHLALSNTAYDLLAVQTHKHKESKEESKDRLPVKTSMFSQSMAPFVEGLLSLWSVFWASAQKANHDKRGSLQDNKQQHAEPPHIPNEGHKTKISMHL